MLQYGYQIWHFSEKMISVYSFLGILFKSVKRHPFIENWTEMSWSAMLFETNWQLPKYKSFFTFSHYSKIKIQCQSPSSVILNLISLLSFHHFSSIKPSHLLSLLVTPCILVALSLWTVKSIFFFLSFSGL